MAGSTAGGMVGMAGDMASAMAGSEAGSVLAGRVLFGVWVPKPICEVDT